MIVDARSKSPSLSKLYRLDNTLANSSKSSIPRLFFNWRLCSMQSPLLGFHIDSLS